MASRMDRNVHCTLFCYFITVLCTKRVRLWSVVCQLCLWSVVCSSLVVVCLNRFAVIFYRFTIIAHLLMSLQIEIIPTKTYTYFKHLPSVIVFFILGLLLAAL